MIRLTWQEAPMNEVVPRQHERSTPGWMAWAVGLLLVGAATSLVIQLLPDWYQLFGPYLIIDADLVVGAFGSIAFFVLPAAVLVGSGRWASGRRLLWWGAAVLSASAVTRLVQEAWFTAFALWPDAVSLDSQWAWTALWLGGAATMVVGHALLAAGLWSGVGRPSVPATRPVARTAVVLVVLLSAGAFLAAAWTAFVIPWNGIENALLATGGGLLLAVGYGALGVVAVAALQSIPDRGALPELLIAAGATLAMLSGAGSWVLPYVFLGEVPEFVGGIFIVLAALAAGGLLVMAAGFALGGRFPATRSAVPKPA
jgi:hypothetical protein